MLKNTRFKNIACTAIAFAIGLGATATYAGDDDDDEIPYDVAIVLAELNDTDGDLGFHALIDGEPWRKLAIETPDERGILKIRARSRLARQGLTEIFFESAEPTFDELTPAEFFARFPEGLYEIEGETIEGDDLESESYFSHVLPEPAPNLAVSKIPASTDCDEYVPVVSNPVVISWDPVTMSHPTIGRTGKFEVEKYELVVEREEPTLLILKVDLPAGVTEFEVPEGFTDLGDEFKYEVLVQTETGNRTATESCFEVD